MGLFRKNKKETVVRNYPTKQEYLAEIIQIDMQKLENHWKIIIGIEKIKI